MEITEAKSHNKHGHDNSAVLPIASIAVADTLCFSLSVGRCLMSDVLAPNRLP